VNFRPAADQVLLLTTPKMETASKATDTVPEMPMAVLVLPPPIGPKQRGDTALGDLRIDSSDGTDLVATDLKPLDIKRRFQLFRIYG